MANFLGNFELPEYLERSHPVATTGDYANVLKTQTVFVYTGGAWVNSFSPIGTAGSSFEINGLIQTQQEINISDDPNSVAEPTIEHFVDGGFGKHEIKIPEAKTFGVTKGLVSKEDWDLLQTLGDNYEYYEIFEVVTSDTGTVTKPSQSIILLDRYAEGVDAIITELDSEGFPIDSAARDALGNVITTTFDADGNYDLSSTPTSPSVALVYLIKIKAKYANNVTEDKIVNKIGVSEEHYSNPNPTPYAVGGIPKGETFLNRNMTNMWDRLLYPLTPTVYESLQFDAGIARPPHSEGRVYYDSQEKTLNYDTDVSGTSINIGQESVIKVVNKTGSDIANGSVVYISGATGNKPKIVLAKADVEDTADCVIGVTTSAISNDTQGYATTFGVVRGLDTQGLGEGSALWLSATNAGEFTTTMPEAPLFPVFIGYVTVDHPTQGEILVNVHNHTLPSTAIDGIHVPLVYDITKDPTGFSNNSDIVVTYSIANRTITLSGTFQLFWKGRVVLSVVSGTWVSDPHTDTPTGPLYLYYNGTAFAWSDTLWTFDMAQIAIVAFSEAGSFRFALKETHGIMAHDTHEDLHSLLGTFRKSGLALSNYTLASTTAANRRPDTSAGIIRDEDINITISQQLKTDASYTIMSLTGSGAISSFSVSNTDIVPLSGSQPYYNQFTGGAWRQTLIAANQYMTMWQLAVPVSGDSTSQNYRLIWVQGQSTGTLSSQQALDPRALNLGTLSVLTAEWVFINRVIIQYTSGNWRIAQVDRIDGTRFSQTASASGSYLTTVSRDETLTGNGTPASPLGVNPTLPVTKIEPLTDGAGTLQITKIDGTSPLIYFDSTANAEKFGFLTVSPVATKGGIDVSSGGLSIISVRLTVFLLGPMQPPRSGASEPFIIQTLKNR